MPKSRILLVTSIFLAILIIFRFIWLALFTTPDHPHAVRGELDLRHWEHIVDYTVSLDGEWEYFPALFFRQSKELPSSAIGQYTSVPSPSGKMIQSGSEEPFRYGTYRLRILVDPAKGNSFGIHIPSIRTSSALYINGHFVGQSGQPAMRKEEYEPLNRPYTSYYFAEGTDEIEIVIQVANFDDVRGGEITHSIQFGLAENIQRDIRLTEGLVLTSCVVYLLHAVYGFILYWIGNRERRLIHFSLVVLCMILGTLVTGDRLLFVWFPINYSWSIKISCLTIIGGGYFLLQCIRDQLPELIRSKLAFFYTVQSVISAIFVLILPDSVNTLIYPFFILVSIIPLVLAGVVMYRETTMNSKDNLFLLLALAASIHSFVWLLGMKVLKIEVISYPFDLLLATIFFAMYWFRQYFRLLTESQTLTQKLQAADKQKDEFLVTVAHELRNPLHGMINISQSLLDREKATLRQQSVNELALLMKVGRRMSLMLNDLLDLARLQENRISLQPKKVSVQMVTSTVMEMLQYMTEGKPVILVNRIPTDFQDVYADENRLIQIMFNLLHNAIKYTPAGEISVHAEQAQPGWVRISVADTGIGMDQELLARIFTRYEQASPIAGGFGLGLSICKELVELHGGTIEARSKRNQGSVFSFTLKLADAPAADTVPSLMATPLAGTEESAATSDKKGNVQAVVASPDRIRLLAVDDDSVNLQVLTSIFSMEPYEITTATSGQEALAYLNQGMWDLVISDVMMPGMTGLELTRKIRERYTSFELPVLLLTAFNREEDIEAGFHAGANDYISKPVQAVELRLRVASLTALKRSVNDRLRMEAAWLQAQIKPHFLVNTFNAIAALSRFDPQRMDTLIEELSHYLRLSIDFQNAQQTIPLEHELELVRSYLYIEQERFGDRLQVIWEADQQIQVELPPLTIQPLVENAIHHGILRRAAGGTVHIRILDLGDHVQVTIADNGTGMDEKTYAKLLHSQPAKGDGIGLYNVNRRLQQYYGHGLQINSTLGEGTAISFTIPKTV